MLEKKEEHSNEKDYITIIKENFHPIANFKASYAIQVLDLNKTLIIEVDGSNISCYYGDKEDSDVFVKINQEGMNSLVGGATSFNEAFMSGVLTAKGNLTFCVHLINCLYFSKKIFVILLECNT